MNKDLQDKWVKALRSGKYEQGAERLCTQTDSDQEAKFCCLGVLYDIAVDDYWVRNKTNNFWIPEKNRSSVEFGKKTMKELGICQEWHDDLANLNDAGDFFIELADLIDGADLTVPPPFQ